MSHGRTAAEQNLLRAVFGGAGLELVPMAAPRLQVVLGKSFWWALETCLDIFGHHNVSL